MNQRYNVLLNEERYPNSHPRHPKRIILEDATLQQAIHVARTLSACEAGCEYFYYVEGYDGIGHEDD